MLPALIMARIIFETTHIRQITITKKSVMVVTV